MVVDGNDDDLDAENRRNVHKSSFLMMMLMSVWFLFGRIRGW